MCTDYTDLNKACPKDAYPLPSINRLVDGTAVHRLLSFLDAYSGYNQIRMDPLDEDKTAFITDTSNYCYRVMPFGLKNAGATYQRLMDKVFRDQIGKNMEIYVDDMVVKSTTFEQYLKDLVEIFAQIRKYDIRLNPEKCVFGVGGGKFLGFMLSERGIEANPEQCQAVIEMRSPASVKEVQRLLGRLNSLARFLPRLAEKVKPMVGLLRAARRFSWDSVCEDAFSELKQTLASPSVLSRPDPTEPLILYLSVSYVSVNTVVIQEKGKVQHPIYFLSRTLHEPETQYQLIEKVSLALLYATRRLRHYFQGHKVIVRTDCPVAKILRKPELAG